MGIEAIKALARAKDRVYPDVQGRTIAARDLLKDLAVATNGLQMSVQQRTSDEITVALGPKKVTIVCDGGRLFEVTAPNQGHPITVVDYEPHAKIFIAVGKDPSWDAEDALAEYVAQRL